MGVPGTRSTDGALAELGDEGDALVRGLGIDATTSVGLPVSVGVTPLLCFCEFIGGSKDLVMKQALFELCQSYGPKGKSKE